MVSGCRPNATVIEHNEKQSDTPQYIKPLVSHVPTLGECADIELE
jgi:hypothetical protein